jgi:hypothetical protein
MTLAFFRSDGDAFTPLDVARSLWSEEQMHGVATSGLLARAAERAVAECGRDELRAARWNVEMFRAAGMGRTTTTATVVREGPRLCLVDTTLVQDGEARARATAVFLAPSADPDGEVWSPPTHPAPPPAEVAPESDEPRVPLFCSEQTAWSSSFREHQNGSRKQTWHTALTVVDGEDPTPFQVVASIADATSMVTNWGSNGVEYINTDISLALARLPVSREVGLAAVDWVSADGIAAGSATVFDRQGPIGTSTVASLANARRTVDFHDHDFGTATGA